MDIDNLDGRAPGTIAAEIPDEANRPASIWNVDSLTLESSFGITVSQQRDAVQRLFAIDTPQTDEMVRLMEEAPMILEARQEGLEYI